MTARLTRDEEMELRRRRFEQSPEGRIKALEDRLSKMEPDERKQEQQRKRAHEFLVARRQAEVLGAIKRAAQRRKSDDKVKDALGGPYGRFFNEGTD